MLHRNFPRRCAGLRRLLEPVLGGTRGPAIEKLGLGKHFEDSALTLPPPTKQVRDPTSAREDSNNSFFGCYWDGVAGFSPHVIEDYFIVLTTGFDIETIDFENHHMRLRHARKFLGWQPDDKILVVPFEGYTLYSTGDSKIKYVHFVSQLLPLLKQHNCPADVLTCLTQPQSMEMLLALRRSRVRADFITHRALLSATKPQAAWCSALGIL